MKEATGELNITVIAVVAIAAIGLIFTTLILPGIRKNIVLTNACTNSNNGTDSTYEDKDGKVTCGNGTCTYDGTTKTCKTDLESNN